MISQTSQCKHDCLMMEHNERLMLYFDDAVKIVMKDFMKSIEHVKPSVNGLEILKYTCNNWRKIWNDEINKLETQDIKLL